jgi:pimeloyl-ACP methyl ester carboxylesterase
MRFQREVNARFEKDGSEAGLAYWHELFGKGTWAGLPEDERVRRRQNAWTITRLSDLRVDCADLGKLKMPVLLIGGANSPPLFKTQLAAVQKCIPAAMQETIPDAAHPMNRHNPAAFNDVVMKFLLE